MAYTKNRIKLGHATKAQLNSATSLLLDKEIFISSDTNDLGFKSGNGLYFLRDIVAESLQPYALDNQKVDKVTGKGLSTNDFTNTLKTKLDGIQTGAQVNAVLSVAGKTGNVILNAADVGARPSTWVPTWGDVTSKPTTFSPSTHNHPISQITGLQTALNGKANLSGATFTGNLLVDGASVHFIRPDTAGGWARAFDWRTRTTDEFPDTVQASVGLYGTNQSLNNMYIGMNRATNPWASSQILIHENYVNINGVDLRERGQRVYSPNNNPSWSQVTSKPSFATVATTGSYNDLSNKPTIPSIPSIMTTTEGNTGTATTQRTINAANLKTIILNHSPAGARPSSWGEVSGKPTFAPSNAQKNSDITKAEIEAKLTGPITTHTHNYRPAGNVPWAEVSGKPTFAPSNAQANRALATQAEAEAGVLNTVTMTPLRVKQAIQNLGLGTAAYTATTAYRSSSWVPGYAEVTGLTAQLNNKVDKVTGKGLSTNDYTTAEKNKLAGIATNATANTGTVHTVGALSNISGFSATVANPSTSPTMTFSILNTANFRNAIGAGTGNSNFSGSYDDLTGTKPPANAQANRAIATQAEAETGTNNTTVMTPLRVRQAINTRFVTSTATNITVNSIYINRFVRVNSSSARTVGIPVDSLYNAQIGSEVHIFREGAGEVTINPITGVTLLSEDNKRRINARYQMATLKKIAANTWALIGALKT